MNLEEMTVFASIDAISVSEASNKNSVKLYIACFGKVLVYTQQHTYKPYSKRYKCSAVLGHPVIRVDLLPHW